VILSQALKPSRYEDVKKSRQRKGREDRKEESFEKMLCALCDLCVQRDSFTSSFAERQIS